MKSVINIADDGRQVEGNWWMAEKEEWGKERIWELPGGGKDEIVWGRTGESKVTLNKILRVPYHENGPGQHYTDGNLRQRDR